MLTSAGPRFSREELRQRYAVTRISEDDWHCHSDQVTAAVLNEHLFSGKFGETGWVLNAGAGVSTLGLAREISLDLFPEPIAERKFPICANISELPLRAGSIDAAVCVGEVLAYCDPAQAISEFARVLRPGGRLILDFGSTRSWRVFATRQYGLSAALLVSEYNGSVEKTWIYDPHYITHLLDSVGFHMVAIQGAHAWSTFMRRLGVGISAALKAEQRFWSQYSPIRSADTITIVSDLQEVS